MRQIGLAAIVAVITLGCSADRETAIVPQDFDADYTAYSRVLTSFVRGETVDYASLKQNSSDLNTFIGELAGLSSEQFQKMSRDEQMALWINAYNGITLRSIIDNYPVVSIKDIKGVWGGNKWSVAGRDVTLDQIEHKILRPEFKEPRIHFAVNCAAVGCPPLLVEPFVASKLEQQLDLVSRNFINNTHRNRINPHNNMVTSTEIFSWFGGDFLSHYGTDEFPHLERVPAAVMNFVFEHVDSTILDMLDRSGEWTLDYLPYDWSLNDIAR